MTKGNSETVFSILSGMEDDLYRVDDYIEIAYLACGGARRNNTLNAKEAEAVKRVLGDAQGLIDKLRLQWKQAFEAAVKERDAKAA